MNMAYSSKPKRRFSIRALFSRAGGDDPVFFQSDTLIVYALLAGLLVGTFLLGMRGIAQVRLLFIAGCGIVAWRAHRVSPGLHVEVVVILFAFAPFLRRIVDINAGFEPNALMLIGPLSALAVPLPALRYLLLQKQPYNGVYTPYLIMIVCLIYGWSISAFQGIFVDATIVAVKMFIPILYAMYLIQRPSEGNHILTSAVRAFIFVTPILSIYGIFQYLNPEPWDRFWMLNSPQINSIGSPEPMKIRVFSMMNSPASLAAFTSCGLLLLGFCRQSWLSILLLVPTCIAMLLTSVRTAWLGIVLGIIYSFMFNSTRRRAAMLTLCLLGAGAFAILMTPFGDMIGNRLATMGGDPSQDGSAHERLQQIMHLYSDQSRYLIGRGLGGTRGIFDPKMLGFDGQLVTSAVIMGIFVGNIHVIALIWACMQGVFHLERDAPPIWLVAGAIVVGNVVVVMPLTAISGGEVGFPVWTFAALLTARQQLVARKMNNTVSIMSKNIKDVVFSQTRLR